MGSRAWKRGSSKGFGSWVCCRETLSFVSDMIDDEIFKVLGIVLLSLWKKRLIDD